MKCFGDRLKELRKRDGITQKNVADALGLAQTTIANYERSIRQPNLEMLNAFADFFNVSLDFLIGRSMRADLDDQETSIAQKKQEGAFNPEELRKDYFHRVLDGDISGAYLQLENTILNGGSLETIYTEILMPSLIEVGLLWENNKLSVGQEHHFSEATQRILDQLMVHRERRPYKNRQAVMLAVHGERHTLGLKMINYLLEEDGWKTYFLGEDVPIQSLIDMIRDKEIDLVALSVTMDYNLNAAENVISTLRQSSVGKEIKILVGGSAFAKDTNLWKTLGADGFSEKFQNVVGTANGLVG